MAAMDTGAADSELTRLRAEVDALRRERDAYRGDLEQNRAAQTAHGSAELQLLSAKLNKEIKEDFFSSVSRMVWVGAVLVGVATFGGYLRLDDIIDDKIDDSVREKRAQIAALETEIEASLSGFKRKADDALRELGERSEAVRAESETAITQIRTRALAVNVTSTGGATTVTTSPWDPWFGDVPERFVGIAGSRHDQVGYETTGGNGGVGGAFSEQFRLALMSGDADANADGLITWAEAVKRTTAGLRPKYPQDPVIVGAQGFTAIANRAPTGSGKGRVQALLIGINDYGGASDLRGPVNDVNQLNALLKSRRLAETAAAEITLLTDRAATSAGIRAALEKVTAAAGKDDVLLIFYSGHVSSIPDGAGSPTGQVKVLVPRDAVTSSSGESSNLPENRLLRVPDLVRAMSKSSARAAVLVIDG